MNEIKEEKIKFGTAGRGRKRKMDPSVLPMEPLVKTICLEVSSVRKLYVNIKIGLIEVYKIDKQ